MAWLKKIAGKLKISVVTLVIILSVIAVILITGAVLVTVFWEQIQYEIKIGRLPEGEAIDVRYVFTNEKSSGMHPNSRILKDSFETQPVELACIGDEPNCEVSFFMEPDGRPVTLTTMILNEETGYPVTLTGVSLEFTDYTPYTDINLGILNSGTFGSSANERDSLKMVTDGDRIVFPGIEEWLNAQIKDPAKVVGETFYLDMAKTFSENPALLSMKADEAEILLIELPFNADTPPGLYAFEVFMQYETPEENRFRTKSQTMNVLVPESINFFDFTPEDAENPVGDQFYITMDSFTGKLSALELNVSPPTNYTMIMQTGLDESVEWAPMTFWKYNLALGHSVQIYPPYSIGNAYPSNDGWKHVVLMPDYQWGLYDLSTDSTVLLDETSRFITPVWSPDDTQLAFFHSTEEKTIGILDVETEALEEISFSLNGSVVDMHWLAEDALMLMVHSGSFTDFYTYFINGDRLEKFYGLAGIDADRFLITSQGKVVALKAEYGLTIPNLKYIYPLEYGTAGTEGWYCEWVETEFVAFCSTGGKVYLVDQVNETTTLLLESGGLSGIEIMGDNGLAVITAEDIVHVFNIAGEEQSRFYIQGISKQHAFGLQFTFLEGH